VFTNRNQVGNILYGIELYRASIPPGHDNRRIAFAKPRDICALPDPQCLDPESGVVRTRWELSTVNGIQCTSTVVSDFGRRIVFQGCSNGKTRTCAY
jgi:hypothetical protein